MTKGHLNRVYAALQTVRDAKHPYTDTERRHMDNALTVMRVYRKPVEKCTRDEMQHRNPICPWCGRVLLSMMNEETGKHSLGMRVPWRGRYVPEGGVKDDQ